MGTVLEHLTGAAVLGWCPDMESWTVGREWEAMGMAAGTVRAGCALPLGPAHLGLIK